MATGGLLWTFTRLNPVQTDTAPVTLLLGGWSAPFGRPRHGSLFNAGVENRYQRTDYPGRNLQPTIHNFGTKKKPIEMNGRWMDRTIPQQFGAQQYVRNWQDFVTAGSVVRMSWGSIISYQIYIHDIDLHFEGQGDVVWQLKAEVLVDEQASVATTINTPVSTPFDVANQMQLLMQNLEGGLSGAFQSFGSLLGMLNQISDSLAILKGQIDAPFAAIYNTCSALTSFETAISSDLTGILSGVAAMTTGILNLRTETDFLLSTSQFLSVPNPGVNLNGVNGGILTGADVAQLVIQKQQNDAAMADMLSLLSYMEAQVNTQRRGTPTTAYTAQMGDTWESIGERVLSSADAGRSIRDMNGIRYGIMPVPGTSYSIPKQ